MAPLNTNAKLVTKDALARAAEAAAQRTPQTLRFSLAGMQLKFSA